MSFTTALYEGDSVIHSEFQAAAANARIAGVKPEGQFATVLNMAELAAGLLKS